MSRNRHGAGAPPASDVSTGVGLAGLLGLFVWLTVARNWPDIAPVFGLSGAQGKLSVRFSD